jgi:hypothetical protein
MSAIGSIESKHDIDDTQDERLSSCEQLWSEAKTNIRTPNALIGHLVLSVRLRDIRTPNALIGHLVLSVRLRDAI